MKRNPSFQTFIPPLTLSYMSLRIMSMVVLTFAIGFFLSQSIMKSLNDQFIARGSSSVDAQSLRSIEDISGRIVISLIKEIEKEVSRALLKIHYTSMLYVDFPFPDELFDTRAKKIYSRPANIVFFWANAEPYSLSKQLSDCHIQKARPSSVSSCH